MAGFTLAELLISLVILGVIATFAIPKILVIQQSQKNIAIMKEDISTLSQAYQILQSQGAITSATTETQLYPYLNYLKMDSSGTLIDDHEFGSNPCNSTDPCMIMANGSRILFPSASSSAFLAADNSHFMTFIVDPDGTYTGSGDGTWVDIYYNGMVRTDGTCIAGTTNGLGWTCTAPDPNDDPPWFKWN